MSQQITIGYVQKTQLAFVALATALLLVSGCQSNSDRPYLKTQSPLTLLSSNDGELTQLYQLTPDGTTDWEMKSRDSFTVIHLDPDHPPIIKTVYDTVPATLLGSPHMAMSKDGRYGLIVNHGFRTESFLKIKLPPGPRTNADLTPEMLRHNKLTAQHSNLISLINLADPDFHVVHRVLLDDFPNHVLIHPDGDRFVVAASKHFYVFRIIDSKPVEVSRTPQPFGIPCFWIHPDGKRIITTQQLPANPIIAGGVVHFSQTCTVQRYAMEGDAIRHLSEVRVMPGLGTKLLNGSMILRISRDEKLIINSVHLHLR
jgi:hypothetical protein